jgi:hypothetical protein
MCLRTQIPLTIPHKCTYILALVAGERMYDGTTHSTSTAGACPCGNETHLRRSADGTDSV